MKSTMGFGLIELIVALLIMGIVVLAIGAALPTSLRTTTDAHVDFLALNAVEDRISLIRMDPRFPLPVDIYAESETPLDDLPEMERTTELEELADGRLQRITVRVTAPALTRPVERTIQIGEP